jgi:hypothetical protein
MCRGGVERLFSKAEQEECLLTNNEYELDVECHFGNMSPITSRRYCTLHSILFGTGLIVFGTGLIWFAATSRCSALSVVCKLRAGRYTCGNLTLPWNSMYFVALADWVLPTAAAPCPLDGCRPFSPPRHSALRPSRAKGCLLKNKFSNLLPICDRPSTLTSHSFCE